VDAGVQGTRLEAMCYPSSVTETSDPELNRYHHVREQLYARTNAGMKLGLDRMRQAAGALNLFPMPYRSVHIAGTNGKGSVSALVFSMLRAEGFRVGLYTSPHLCEYRERFRVNEQLVSPAELTDALTDALRVGDDLTFFELTTLAAFALFARAKVDIAVFEVGLGGRLDATNILVKPEVTAVTSIGLDHQAYLGDTLAAIALEKGGIFKPRVPVVLGTLPAEAEEPLLALARSLDCTVYYAHECAGALPASPLLGPHQVRNMQVACTIARLLGLSSDAVRRGAHATSWPARFERLQLVSGNWILDGAHNLDGVAALAATLLQQRVFPEVVIFGAFADKDWQAMLAKLCGAVRPSARSRGTAMVAGTGESPRRPSWVIVEPEGRAAVPSSVVAEWLRVYAASTAEPLEVFAATSVREGVERASAVCFSDKATTVLVTGSLRMVGEARGILLGLPMDPPVAF
jgi:dihydrofolate synthase / folylpolyglutamate synthase